MARPERSQGHAQMGKELFKCFACGKIYSDEKSALACHDAPIQRVLRTDEGKKPRFLGN